MKCYFGFALDFKDCFTKIEQLRLYGGAWNGLDGVSRESTDEAWIFIDNLAKHDIWSGCDIIISITETVIHELIHLCGVDDEEATFLGTNLVMREVSEIK